MDISSHNSDGDITDPFKILDTSCLFGIYASWTNSFTISWKRPFDQGLEALEELANTAYEIYGPVFRSWVSVVPFFHIFEPNHIQLILGSNRHTDKNFIYSLMHNFLGSGLITSNGQTWKSHRKLMQPYFHINILETFIAQFSQCAEKLADNIEPNCDINITSYINNCVLDILHRVDPYKIGKDHQKSPFRDGQVLVTYRVTHPWLLLDAPFQFTKNGQKETQQKYRLRAYTKMVLENKRQVKQVTPKEFNSLIEMLMEISDNNPEFTEDDVINEACTLMLAGQDSVSSSIAFVLYHLARHPDVQEKLTNEIMAVFDKYTTLDIEKLRSLVYLEQCIKETLRLCPSVPMIARRLSEDIVLGKHTLPAGCHVFLSPFATHRLPHVFKDPLKFDPERFSPDNLTKIHPYSYFPFSAGPRNCIGYKFGILEIKVVLAQILRKYRIELVPGRELNLLYRVTIRAKGGVWLRFLKHDASSFPE
ncbi:cytochrome p450 [Rhyzopertha dominica]|nr:cytochrome p450 [Rhyzopertha dominica]